MIKCTAFSVEQDDSKYGGCAYQHTACFLNEEITQNEIIKHFDEHFAKKGFTAGKIIEIGSEGTLSMGMGETYATLKSVIRS